MEQYYMLKAYSITFSEDFLKFQNEKTRAIIWNIINNLYEGQEGRNHIAAYNGMGNLNEYIELFKENY